MMPLTATAATAAPDEDANASAVIRGTDFGSKGTRSSAARHAHMAPAPPMNQRRRVRQESTIGAQRNSNVNARAEAAMMATDCWTDTPSLISLLPTASPMTPTDHAAQSSRKNNAPEGQDPPPT